MLNESLIYKLLYYIPKIFIILVGVVLSLSLSGDIDKDGNLNLTKGLLIKFISSVMFSLLAGEFIIEFFDLQSKSLAFHGFIMFMCAVSGLMLIGMVYQSIKVLDGKPPSEIVKEIKDVFFNVFRG